MNTRVLVLAALALAACGSEDFGMESPSATEAVVSGTPSAPASSTPGAPVVTPSEDLRSTETAQKWLTAYLLGHQAHIASADTLWGPMGPPAGVDLTAEPFRLSGTEIESARVVSLGEPEGAAGSIYVQIPVALTTTTGDQTDETRLVYTLRRVNDVPGAEPWSLRWHLERVERAG